MPEIPNVVPGEPVESDWGNDIRDRVITRYADATARTASLPFPGIGQLTWIDAPGQVDYWDGATWVKLTDQPALDLKVAKAGDTMTGLLSGTQLVMNSRIQGPLETFGNFIGGNLTVTTSDQIIDSFVTPRTARWLVQVVMQGTYASLTDADVFQLKIKQTAAQVAIATTNMFRAWGAPGVTTGHFSSTQLYATPFVAAGTVFDFTANRFGTDGGAFLTSMDWSAHEVEN